MRKPAGTPSPSFVAYSRGAIQENGMMALYDGLGAGIWRQLFYATSRYGLYETYRDLLAQYRPMDFVGRSACAVAAGACAAVISCPAEVSLVRMSNDATLPESQRRNYKGVLDCAQTIMKTEGFGAFYRGCTPFVIRAMMVGGTQVATYDQFRTVFSGLGVPDGVPITFCSAMSAGLVYATATMPVESAKNRMASQRPGADGKLKYTGTFQSIGKIASEEGVLSLWNGFTPYYIRCGGHTVAMFIAIEQLRKAYWVSQGY